ncbi:hypothetical protein [Blautia intestinalis]|uniref:hypothetical protein n=1 Tax=Blautia intestinalis TaxID=2763028 RepID=UPI0022E29F89|nr:hypothetical protein [Blautia intestinalis]
MDNVIGKKVRMKDIVDVPIYLQRYYIKYWGRTGTIVAVTFNTYVFENITYTIDFGEYGHLNVTSNYFIFIDEEENENMAALTGYAAVAVIEQGCYNKEYYYAIYADGYNYKVGDKVLVSNNNDIWTIKRLLTVQQAAEEHKAAITAEVVTHVDNSAYLKRVKQRKEAAAIKKDMDKIIKQMDEQMKYDIYAEENPDLKKMLERYRELKGEWD